MNNNFLLENNLNFYSILIGSGLILGCTLYYLIKSNNTTIPTTNMEPFTNEELETIYKENMVTVSSANVEDFITDSDFETDVELDSQSRFESESDSTSDIESILKDPDIFFMPNVDFDVCPIEELKLFEFNSLYAREIAENSVTQEEIMEFLCSFSKEELATNWINDYFLKGLSLLQYLID
jgi:hypothetical protein